MINWKKLWVLLLPLVLSGCMVSLSAEDLYALPKLPQVYEALSVRLTELLANGAEYAPPPAGGNLPPVQMVDINGDGSDEALAFLRLSSEERPLKIYIFRAVGDGYEQAGVISGSGTSIHSIRYADLDGNGVQEIIVSWSVSAEIQALAVYALEDLEPVQLMSTPYARYEIVDLDGDGDRELAVISCQSAGTGIDRWQLDVYEWDGERWAGTTHRPEGLAEDFNRERVFQFYEDGTAYVSYSGGALLLGLSRYFPDPDQPPQTCILGDPAHLPQVRYTFREGQLWLTLAGQILNEQTSRLSGYFFDYVCPLVYEDYSHDGSAGHLNLRDGVLHSDYAIEPAPPQLSEVHQNLLTEIRSQCDSGYPNAFALHDINGDGAEELLVRWMPDGAISSAWGTTVYDSAGRETFHGFGELTFYENGTVSVPWSHNQGPACAIWPYRLCQWDAALDAYEDLGGARARSDRLEGFPRAADRDGDGMVYYIGEDAYREENPVDGGAYQTWRDQHLAGAEILPVRYYRLTEDIVSLLQ